MSAETASSRVCPVARFSPAQISTVLHWPIAIASAACLTMTAGEAPPAIIDELNLGRMPRYSASTVPSMKYGSVKEYAVSTPSMSLTLSPVSSSARIAACALSPSPLMCGTLPISDSPTPTIATLLRKAFRSAFVVAVAVAFALVISALHRKLRLSLNLRLSLSLSRNHPHAGTAAPWQFHPWPRNTPARDRRSALTVRHRRQCW